MRTFLVTGGGGFIGSHLMAYLAGDGSEVVAVGRDSLSLYRGGELQAEVKCAIANGEWRFDAIDVDVIDCVYHLATRYIVDHDTQNIAKLVEDNVGFTAQMLEATSRFAPRVIVAESYWQYASQSTRYHSNNLYAATKNAAGALLDYYAKTHELEVVRAVIGDSYGPGDTRNKLIYSLIAAALDGHEVKLGDPEHHVSLLHVSDVVDGLVRLGAQSYPADQKIYNLCSGDETSLADLVEAVEKACDRKIDVTWRQYRRRAANLLPWRQGVVPLGWERRTALPDGLKALVRGIRNETQ